MFTILSTLILMTENIDVSAKGLLAALREFFGLSQLQAARLLGVRQQQVGTAEAGLRSLPHAATDRLKLLRSLLTNPAPLPGPDPAPLQARQTRCLHQARRLRFRLQYELPERGWPAQRLVAAAQALPAALAQGPALPALALDTQQAQLTLLHNAAEAELERNGPTSEILLRARLAGLLAEADVLAAALLPPGE
jgi:transcriptional regulator with XRE-family HTH domain